MDKGLGQRLSKLNTLDSSLVQNANAFIFSDSSDVVHSLPKLPKAHMMDDSCTYVRHNFLRYPEESRIVYGDLRGCFEPPSNTEKPSSSIDCPDITPLTMDTKCVNRDAMLDPSPLTHPDSQSLTRYCLGTALQMNPKKKSHKSPKCAFHNPGLAIQGKLLKTMTQEALQNCRKFRTIQVV